MCELCGESNDYNFGIMKRILGFFMLVAVMGTVMVSATSCKRNAQSSAAGREMSDGGVRHQIICTLSEEVNREERMKLYMDVKASIMLLKGVTPGLEKVDLIYDDRPEASEDNFIVDMWFNSRAFFNRFVKSAEHLALLVELKPSFAERRYVDTEIE